MNIEKKKTAFTLVEMMAVVVIIAILAAVVAPKFFGQVSTAQITAAKQTMAKIDQAVTLYKFDNNKFPESLRDLVKKPDDAPNWKQPYLPKIPKDPWGNDFDYRLPGEDGRPFDIVCYGADGQDGGEGDNADIVSWDKDE